MLSESRGDTREAMVKFVDTILDKGLVQLGELGGGPKPFEGDAVKTYESGIRKLMEAEKLSYADAAVKLSSENPELHEAYVLAEGGAQ